MADKKVSSGLIQCESLITTKQRPASVIPERKDLSLAPENKEVSLATVTYNEESSSQSQKDWSVNFINIPFSKNLLQPCIRLIPRKLPDIFEKINKQDRV